MPRWLFTALLASAAVGGVALVPRFLPSPSRAPTPPRPVATTDGSVSLSARLDQDAVLLDASDPRFLVVTLSASSDEAAPRVPVDLAMVVDTSGSMQAAGKLEHARAAIRTLAAQLREGDRVSLVGFDDEARVLLPGAPFTSPGALQSLASTLGTGGSTNLSAGLDAGRAQLGDGERLRRLLVVTDGQANRGVVDPYALRSLASGYASEGVTVSTIGLGADYNETVVEALADAGGGTYTFVEHAAQLAGVVAGEMDQAASTVARDVTLDVRLAAGVRLRAVHGWETAADGRTARVFVGQLAAGQERKVVLELDVDADRVGTMDVADVSARWEAADDGEAHEAMALVAADVTEDATVARASYDALVGAKASSAVAGTYARQSMDAMQRGDTERARRQAKESRSLLLQVLGTKGLDAEQTASLRDLDDTLAEVEDAPEGSEKVMAKKAQSASRGLSK